MPPRTPVWIASSLTLLAMTAKLNLLTSRPEFQALKSGCDVDADLALQAERLQRDGIVGAADQRVAAGADAERGRACAPA